MTFQQFSAFAAVARHMNMTKAALELRTSQPSVSKHLKNLEDTYKVKLLNRNGKTIELTEEGTEFLGYVESILDQLQQLERRFLKHSPRKARGALIIGGTYALSATVLPLLLKIFKKEFPNLAVILRSTPTLVLEKMVVKGSLDLALTSAPPRSSELTYEPCMTLKVIAFAAKGYHIPSEHNSMAELPLIVRGGGSQSGITDVVLSGLRNEGFKPKIVLRCESPEAIKMAVKQKLGIGIIFEEVVKEEIARGLFKRVRIPGFPAEAKAYVIYHKHRSLSPGAETFLGLLRKWCASRRNRNSPRSKETSYEVLNEP
jgi:DNA-binding transcriptional LysR family regulator